MNRGMRYVRSFCMPNSDPDMRAIRGRALREEGKHTHNTRATHSSLHDHRGRHAYIDTIKERRRENEYRETRDEVMSCITEEKKM